MSFATAAASSATASLAAEASSGAPRAMCIPPRTGAGSGSCSRPRSSALRRPAAHAESTTACTSPMPPPAACSNRSAIALCASFARCASSSLRRRPIPTWPEGLRATEFDPEHDAHAFHAAQQEAFADAWEYTGRDFESWSKTNLQSERFDPALWCVVRAGDEIAAGAICTARHVRRRLRPDPLHASPMAQARRRRGAPRGRVPQALGGWRASASGWASTRRATPERFASTSGPE